MSAWLLPDSIADVLPPEAAHIEALRRSLLDAAGRYGYELLIPPLVEHLESLLTGAGEALELQTFRLVDQLSGRMVGSVSPSLSIPFTLETTAMPPCSRESVPTVAVAPSTEPVAAA